MSEQPAPWPSEAEMKESKEKDQKVFDTVMGPNLRLRDNLIQLAVIVAGTAIGAGVGAGYARASGNDPIAGVVLGAFAGLLLSLFLSGFVIGVVRAILAVRK